MCARVCECPGTPYRPSTTCCHRKPCIETRRAPSPKAPRGDPTTLAGESVGPAQTPDVVTALDLSSKPVVHFIERARVINARCWGGFSHGRKVTTSRTCVKGIPILLIYMELVLNLPLQPGYLSVLVWFFDVQSLQHFCLCLVDGRDPRDRLCLVDTHRMALNSSELRQRPFRRQIASGQL